MFFLLLAATALLEPFAAWAGFTRSQAIGTKSRKKLENGTVYTVTSDIEIKASSGLSAFYMDENSTAVLYIAAGKTLTLQGGNASGTTGAGAGIEIPSSSTLIVTGGGTIKATGGKGANGSNGGNGENANVDGSGKPHDDWGRAGVGGNGGAGGGGAGAGIGGNGGSGGAGRDEPRKASNWHNTNGDWECRGYDGYSGYSGSAGGNGGTIYVLGSVNVTATGGAAGSNGGYGGSDGSKDKEYWTLSYRAGGGGGGGGGGSGCAASNFGGGGGGGGAGGGGGEGSRYRTTQGYTYRSANGGHGGGGSGGVNGGGTRTDGEDGWFVGTGGNGGSGGSKGSTGSGGTAYKANAATFSGAGTSRAETHSAIEYTLTFHDGARLTTNTLVKFGYSLPAGPTTHRVGYDFKGWYSNSDGSGTRYYDENGNPVVSAWTDAGDVTLYPRWQVGSSEEISRVTLYVNGTTVREGVDASGDGWNYSSEDGKIYITGAGGTYNIRGRDEDGFASIRVKADRVTIKVTGELWMEPGSHGNGYMPLVNEKTNARATLEVAQGATCDLTGGTGCPAIWANLTGGYYSSFLIKAKGALTVTGGDGAADIGPRSGHTGEGGDFYIETYDNWFSNLRLGHGMGENDGLVNDKGYSAKFFSYPASNRVYCVRMSQLEATEGDATRVYLQRVPGEVHDTFQPDASTYAWFWLPNGAYEWAQEPYAVVESNNLWTASVNGEHTAAEFFTPLHVVINGDDMAHMTGPGWYTVYENVNDSKWATLFITNAGPHVISGSGNACIELLCDTSITISNLMLNVASWQRSTIYLQDGVDLDLRIEGTNMLTSSSKMPGITVGLANTLTIDGDGQLKATGGEGAAGIGGSCESSDRQRNGPITINGGRITAIGGKNAAGIGSARAPSSGDANGNRITINGGVVTARGGQYAAAIGGGYNGSADVTINGGTVFPTAGSKAAAIGAGYEPRGGSTVNRFGFVAVYAKTGDISPAAKNDAGHAVYPVTFDMGLGASCNVTNVIIGGEVKTCRDIWTDKSGKLTLWLEPTSGEQYTITITAVDGDGKSVTKSWGYKMDDEGNSEFSTDMVTLDGVPVIGGKDVEGADWIYSGSSGILTILSGDHNITGNSTNGTINVVVTGDGVNITIEDLTLMTTKSYQSPFVVSNSCTLTLVGDNTIECTYNPNARYASQMGSQYTAGVEVPNGASLVIEGEGVLMANAGMCGAGIGSRGKNESAGSITISGGYIYATGGWGKSGGGAGIGGGNQCGVASILVTGGYVYAKGAKGACGIGTGNNGPLLDDSAFHVTGGTVLVEKGEGSFSDFDTACGSVISPTGSKSIVIDGGSVRPKNFSGATNPYPNPVNSNGVQLVCAMIEGLGSVDAVTISDPLWPQYDGVDIVSDEDGCVCLWGVRTNVTRIVEVQNPNIEGGSASFEVSALTNTVNVASGGAAADSHIVDGVTCWRVEVHALPAGKRMSVGGDAATYVHGKVTSDYTGKSYLYLPDGVYDFTFGDPSFSYSYHAVVDGAPTTATYTVGLLVDGVDVGAESGEGWSYNGTLETLTLNRGREYVLSGTNLERRVSVCAAAKGVKVRNDRLVLMGANAGPFCLTNSPSTLEFTGGTLSSGDVSVPVRVSGGAFEPELTNPVTTNGATAYRVTVGTFQSYSLVEIEDIEGLGGYDTSGIYADASGMVYLYLPNGEYYFRVRNDGNEKEMIVNVDGMEETAEDYVPTGVYVNGRDAARLKGDGWTNRDGLVHLTAATNYVITGTNDGAAVTIKAEWSKATITLDNLVMTNDMMTASPLAVGGSDGKTQITLVLSGTNILYGVESGLRAVELSAMAEVTVEGDGYLEAQGGESAPGIGVAQCASSDSASFTLKSGEIAASGGENGAGIGGGNGQNGVKVYVYGGVLGAQGGSGGAGIGGGSSGKGAAVTVTNGVVSATGGEFGAGIGGGENGSGESLTVTDYGKVTATGGTDASGAGGGKGGASGRYRQSGGTVVVVGNGDGADIGAGKDGGADSSSYTTVIGGSLKASTDKITAKPKNSSGSQVYRVTIPTGRPNFDVSVMGSYNGYLLTGAVTDDEGKLYIWLPNGTYRINIGRTPFRAVVNGGDTEAEQWAVGVEVNGEDIALQSGEGWAYDLDSYKLSVFGDGCTISGSNTTDTTYIQFTNNVSVAISNLVIETTSWSTMAPFSVLSQASVVLTLAGSNSLSCGARSAGGNGYAGMNVPYGSTLSITNIDTIVSLPDLDSIAVTTNRVYDIVYDDEGHVVGTNKYIEVYDDGSATTNDYLDVITVYTNYVDTVVPPILTVSGGLNSAGIGGGQYESHGTIEINGGAISATGYFGAGIGSGFFENSGENAGNATTLRQGEIRINGGVVEATGGEDSAGIGGGYNHSGGQIILSGGTVVATGGSSAAGIGGGSDAYGHTIKISGGVVEAYGGTRGAGIGGGAGGESAANTEQCKITISGGRVKALADMNGAGIGSGYQCGKGASVNITGGTVVASGTPDEYGSTPDDIGVGGNASSATVYPLKITGASVHALRHTNASLCMSPAPSNGTARVYCVTVQTGATNELAKVQYLDGYSDDSQIYGDENGKIYLWLPNGTYVFYAGGLPFKVTVNGADTTATEWLTGVTADGVDVSFAGADGKKWAYDFGTKTLYVNGDCVISGMDTAGYVNILAGLTEEDEGGGTGTVACSFTISNLFLRATSRAKASPITVKEGTVTICLAGANRLDATETDSFAGLNVVQPATLVITNLEENARLEAYSGEDAAAIGGNQNKEDGVNYTTGTICIRGGIIYAQAKDSGAGIGSGYRGRSGDISISGGRIETHGGGYRAITGSTWCGAAIGGGDSATVNSTCKIAISGGTVEAYGGSGNSTHYAADIGAGYSDSSEYYIVISGGSVHPESDDATRSFTQRWRDEAVIPRNNDYNPVYKVTLDDCVPNAKANIEMDGYGSNDIWADLSGKVYLWLATGSYNMKRDGKRYTVTVDSSGNYTIELAPIGVEVDGVDVKARSGAGWTYDVNTSTLAITGNCTLSGTNAYDVIMCRINSNATVTFSDLCLTTATNSPVSVAPGVTARVLLAGTNSLTCALSQYNDYSNRLAGAGLRVPVGATLRLASKTGYVDGVLYAQGGVCSAGIGGILQDNGVGGAAGTIVIESGRIYATGGNYGAGIGGGRQGDGGTITVSGGIVTATVTAGSYASAIGGGMGAYAAPPAYTQSGGTVLAYGSQSGVGGATNPSNVDLSGSSIIVSGGSLLALGNKATSLAVTNGTGEAVYCVTVSNLTAGAEVTVTGLAGYGKDGIYADDDGRIHLWLPVGEHNMIVNGKRYVATVASDGSSTVELVKVGVLADGIDVANGSGPGWSYDFDAGVLVVSGGVTLSGTNTEGRVSVVAATEGAFALTISNLCLKATADAAPIFVTNGTVTICLAGTNTIGVAYDNHAAAVGVGSAASLVVTNLDENAYLEATGGGNFPAVGGNKSGNIGNITIAGGTIVANGGYRAAAIGLMTTSEVPAGEPRTIRITGGRVYAVASGSSGNYGAGIGGASQTKVHGLTVSIEGGTVSATGPLTSGGSHGADIGNGQLLASRLQGEVAIRITGGSVITNAFGFTATGDTEQYSVNALGETNWCVRISGFAANERADIELDGYGTNDIYADADGNIWLWLADGVYLYTTGGARHALKMEGGTATVVDVPDSYGVQVDGEDVTQLSGGAWAFDLFANELSLTGDVTLSGTNTAGEVKIIAAADVTVSPERLVLGVGAGEDVLSGAGTVTITNGTVHLTGSVTCPVVVLGGSLKLNGTAAIAISNGTAQVYCVAVTNLAPNSAVAFDGLPAYYGTSGIYSDDTGSVYLWLPENWTTPVTPHLLAVGLLASPGTSHTFAVNGYSYTVTIPIGGGEVVATKGAALELEGFRINGFEVKGDMLAINVSAKPDTWLYGFCDEVIVRMSTTLPIAKTDDTVIDLSSAEVSLETDGSVTYAVSLPPTESASRFFTIDRMER